MQDLNGLALCQAPVVQRLNNFKQWMSHCLADKMYKLGYIFSAG